MPTKVVLFLALLTWVQLPAVRVIKSCAANYDEYSEWCEESSAVLAFEIKNKEG